MVTFYHRRSVVYYSYCDGYRCRWQWPGLRNGTTANSCIGNRVNEWAIEAQATINAHLFDPICMKVEWRTRSKRPLGNCCSSLVIAVVDERVHVE